MNGFLANAVIYIIAAIICVPLAKRLGMGSVLGYLLAGILIGPYLLGFITNEGQGQDIMHATEFGVVMMLFLIGLELEPKNLWKIRDLIIRIGLSQVLVSAALVFVIGLLIPIQWQISLAIALSMALSSTAIVLQSLKERNEMNSPLGKMSFGVLLMQDIAVIPILAILPLLVVTVPEISGEHTDGMHGLIDSLPGWAQTLSIFGAIGIVVLLGRYGFGPLLNFVAKTRLRELFTASALLIVVGISYLMEIVGLSPALGAFLAGVILANSPYRHALESDLEPFKGLLLGLFFMAVGSTINFSLIFNEASTVFAITFGIILLKTLVLLVLGKVKKLQFSSNLKFAIGLSQVGEFSFVTYAFAQQLGIFDQSLTDTLMAVTALSMTISPILMLVFDKFIIPLMSKNSENKEGKMDSFQEKNKVILIGFGHFGSTLGRFLRASGVEATILDSDPERIEYLRKMGFKVYFGDGTRAELLQSAGAEDADILISALDNTEYSIKLVELCKQEFPHLEVMIRAKNRYDAFELMDKGVTNIYREHLDTSIKMGEDVLKKLGFRAHTVHRMAKQFHDYDEEALKVLVKFKNNQKEYISRSRQQIEMQESLLSGELMKKFSVNDHAWDSDGIKEAENTSQDNSKQ
ncbi:monovalent cation:proton antiporter-2 (CPA2) family protein [Algoriphagus machipongonensis]|uniref:Glutathione-regulated potassium-efflux system protein KefB n=1 Tax=Algoriphagus machipongonensis TaxID=388413 RepID=A3HTD3_9BACT|nr:monovalent cation:proton antiporter-2 (CPA2) family protein [Algoriphagus machipongonensis]EAZ83101.1 glutathione-regulated potassium-efflux system protein KefB [Algoriphagus machipongonensis]